MNKQTFNSMVKNLQAHCLRVNLASTAGMDMANFDVELYRVISILLKETFEAVKVETLEWYLYEYRKGEMQIRDGKTREVLFDFDKEDDLWKYMIEK